MCDEPHKIGEIIFMNPTNTNSTTLPFTTYYIEGSERSNLANQGSLAINVIINQKNKLISWQDTTFHAKAYHFSQLKIEEDNSIKIINEDNTGAIHLIPLTVQLFKEKIKADIPEKYQQTDELLRNWYSHFIEDPEDPELYR